VRAEAASSTVALLEQRRLEAMTRGDVEALAPLLADDLTYTHSSGMTETKEQFLESLRSRRLQYVKVDREDVRVRTYGSTAVITGLARVVVRSEGKDRDLSLRFTDVWIKRGGRWQMVAWQSTVTP
jgi:uncharacterized protein (TIGR02246 family)